MAVAYFHEWVGVTREMARRVSDRINAQLGDAPPEGAVYHAEGETDAAWWVFDVWESEDAARRFYDDVLAPVTDAMDIPRSEPRTLPVHWHSLEAPPAAGTRHNRAGTAAALWGGLSRRWARALLRSIRRGVSG